jgi:NTE family protein
MAAPPIRKRKAPAARPAKAAPAKPARAVPAPVVPAPAVAAPQGFACVALLLQGGGALGAYQGGVYEALAAAKVMPNWVVGISIGAINAALIAGNAPERRVERLHAFWETVTERPISNLTRALFGDTPPKAGNILHQAMDRWGAAQALVTGAPGFFEPRFPPPFAQIPGSEGATSFYDTSKLKATLESLVDFDRINSGEMRFSVGAVNVRTGNFTYFDTETDKIRVEHILASGALPPGFPAVEIDGEYYWDGGLVSNTPLQWLVEARKRRDTLAFQVDLWSARGEIPRDLTEVAIRQKEIQFSSRTRASTDHLKHLQNIRGALSVLLRDVPPEACQTEEAQMLREFADRKVYNVVQLIYRSQSYEADSKDYNFSRRSMVEHWQAGQADAELALSHAAIFQRPPGDVHFQAFDFRHTQDIPPRAKTDEGEV